MNRKASVKLSKPVVNIYLNKHAKSTEILSRHLAEHITKLNNRFIINFIYITKANSAMVSAKGVKKTPTLLYGNRKYEGLQNIIKILTPPDETKEHFGIGVTSPEDMLHKYQNEIMTRGEEEEDDDEHDPAYMEQRLKEKMAAMQKRRPEMRGVSGKSSLKGGRALKTKKNDKKYHYSNGDSAFLHDAGKSNTNDTPSYTEDTDGELILEEYYLTEANRNPNSR